MENKGTITQIISAVVDVSFKDQLPSIYNALKVKVGDKELVLEENKTPHNWKNPVWRHKDGSVAEW